MLFPHKRYNIHKNTEEPTAKYTEMRAMKKILLLIFCIMALGLSGCGEKTGSNNFDSGISDTVEDNNVSDQKIDQEQVSSENGIQEDQSAEGISSGGEEESEQNQIDQEPVSLRNDKSEAEDKGYRYSIGDATITLENDFGYEDMSNDFMDGYMFYLSPQDRCADWILVYYKRNIITGQVTKEAAIDSAKAIYPKWAHSYVEDSFRGSTLLKEEPFTIKEEPAYHFVFSGNSMGIGATNDAYLLMANQHDLLTVMHVRADGSQKDFSEEYLDIIQNIETAGIHDDPSNPSKEDSSIDSANSSKNRSNSASFTNKYGTPTTKCAHPGCNNYIAPSGDTNCCTSHSNRCADCGKYIDEDAMYCIDCLTKAAQDVNSGKSSNTRRSSSQKTGKKCAFLENGEEVCNNQAENGSPYCSYHKKMLDDAYNSIIGN